MDIFGNGHEELNLKSDFPARESFREALLDQLKVEVTRRAQMEGDPSVIDEEQLEMAELSDDEMWMFAAAGDQYQGFGDSKFNTF